jgi:plasmid stabilization system protein ParE
VAEPLFHPEADAEYIAAIAWYQSRSPRAADRFETEVERVLNLISESPEMCPKYDEVHRFSILRRFPYSIVYRLRNQRAFVVAVAHSSRSPDYWENRR